ncbi:MAG: four helix bundle protein [Microbacter sp.]
MFSSEEKYALTDQIRRSSRSVSGNLAEAWRKRRYEKAFIAKLNDCEGEAAETQVWLEYALACECIDKGTFENLYKKYDDMLGMLVNMSINPSKWTL